MNKNRMCLLCLASIMLLILVWTPMSVQATPPEPQPNLPFQFAQQDEVSFAWEDVKKGEAIVQVLNNTTTKRTLSVAISDMGFKDVDGGKLDTDKVLKPSSETVTLPAGGTASITFSVEDGVVPKAATYSGFLHVSESSGNTAIHLPITITVSDAGAPCATSLAGESPVPLVDTWTVQYFRGVPPILGLDKLCSPRNRFLPLDIDANKGQTIALDCSKPLGYLTGAKEGMATVSWVGQPQVQPNNKQGIELAFAGLDHPGDYTGEIDLLPDDEEKGPVNLTVTVTDFILWPILAIFLGIVVAIIGQHLIGVNRNILTLYKDEADTKELNAGDQYKGYRIIDFEWQRKKIRDAISNLRKKHGWSTVTLGAENEKYAEIVESLKKLDEHVKGWNAFGNELTALETARNAVSDEQPDENKKHLHQPKHKDNPPAFKGEAKTLLTGVRLAFEQLEVEGSEHIQADTAEELFATQREKVIKATTLAKSWQGWVDRLVKVREGLKTTQAQAAAQKLPKVAQDAKFELGRVETLLWEAPDLDALEAAEMEKSLRMAEGLVAGLQSYEPLEEVERAVETLTTLQQQLTELLSLPDGSIDFIRQLLSPIQPLMPYPIPGKLPIEGEKRLALIQRTLYRSDWLMFWLALIGGVHTGLTALYFGKAFGTPLDYIGALAWGFGTKTTLEVIYGAINRLVRVVG